MCKFNVSHLTPKLFVWTKCFDKSITSSTQTHCVYSDLGNKLNLQKDLAAICVLDFAIVPLVFSTFSFNSRNDHILGVKHVICQSLNERIAHYKAPHCFVH